MQPAKRVNTLRAGAQHEVIGIPKKDISPRRAHAFGHHRLDGRGGAHGHKGRRANIAARGGDDAGARLARGGRQVKGKSCSHGRVVPQDGAKAKGELRPYRLGCQSTLKRSSPWGIPISA